MTIGDAHQAFKLELDKIDSLNYPNLLPEEIDYFLNKAQENFVKQRYGNTNNKRQSFEQSQKRTDDLKALVKNAILTPASNVPDNIDPNAQFVELPVDYWFTVQERCKIGHPTCHNTSIIETVEVDVIDHDNFNKIISNPFRKPNNSKVLRIMAYNQTELIHAPQVTIFEYYLRYLKKPIQVSLSGNITFELSDHTHEEIVNEAVSLALESIESIRTKTFDPIVKNQEE